MPQPQVPAFPDETGCSLRPAAGKAALSQTAECHAAAPAAAHPARSPVTRKNSSPGLCRGSLNFLALGYSPSDGTLPGRRWALVIAVREFKVPGGARAAI